MRTYIFFTKFFKFLFKVIRTRIRILFFGVYNPRWYPKQIRELTQEINDDVSSELTVLEKWEFLRYPESSTRSNHISVIRLAGRKCSIKELKNIWAGVKEKENDVEVINAAHRFHWLLEELALGVDDLILKSYLETILIWQKIHFKNKKGIAWQPYNVSERICNLSIFASFLIDNPYVTREDLLKLTSIIEDHLLILKDNLEYPASGIVNNHIINNARALYIGAYFTQRLDFLPLAKAIFKIHLPSMIGRGGYLLEASSHYQLLLTRTLVEVSIIARTSQDHSFSRWIDSFADLMISASNKLMPLNLNNLNQYPSIGDISPDVPFNWFDPREKNNEGAWNRIWKNSFGRYTNLIFESKVNDGWITLSRNKWFLVTYSHPDHREYPIGHGHKDFGSFILYYDGVQIFTDVGRYTYNKSSLNDYIGHEGFAHSTMIFSGASSRSKYSIFRIFDSLKENKSKRSVLYKKDSITWKSLEEKSYKWIRKLNIGKVDEIEILDSFQANSASGSFYLAPEIKIKKISTNSVSIQAKKELNYIITFSGVKNISLKQVNFYSNYGTITRTNKIEWEKITEGTNSSIRIVIRKT